MQPDAKLGVECSGPGWGRPFPDIIKGLLLLHISLEPQEAGAGLLETPLKPAFPGLG